ncbi:MAG: FkbM family methyltransferase [Rhizobium sp.]
MLLVKKLLLTLVLRESRKSRALPQTFVGFIFDYISIKSILYGRFENLELDYLEQHVFPSLPERRYALDVGANIGIHTISFSNHFQHVHAFEPHPLTFDILSLNTRAMKNITVHQKGASSEAFVARAVSVPGNIGAAHIVTDAEAGADTIGFACDRLDAMLGDEAVPVIDFMKIDVEGHELSALKGAEAILAQSAPLIAFELLRAETAEPGTELIRFLNERGYRYFYEIRRTLFGTRRLVAITRFRNRNHKMVLAAKTPLNGSR